ncbi:hypothetical protein FNF27_05923 [Cafeteria roenbergensis]|uniref:subtilisin n=1 Tax=Cafeteria roenbergensis TaxID=33653 RepID=A0A5A8CNP6_CAFRO|nr:hypothetical protein FNF31_07260 [Cafeteria roenbergensis]KAA0154682.1 hypothetical protein FNF29_02211 [Cafeteria roenbergensis]KAA0172568.1 hypothetical protein FNF27_05923 [Cafeteria roenbergensis]|eukprot:KAA0154682.1 hypothetical protein FNF29_02211 [Cafeteria roenbergensis]
MLRIVAALAALAAAAASPMWEKVARAPKHETLDFTVATPMSNVDGLQAAFEAVSDPDSPKYGMFMTKSEINEMTATPGWMKNEVLTWLQSHGHSCSARSDSIKCRGSVGAVEKMLSARMHTYQHSKTGDLVHQLDGSYTFPASMEGKIDFVSGLSGFPVEHLGRARALTGGEQFTVPETIVSAYNLQGAKGSSSITQAAVEFQGYPAYAQDDLTTFIQQTAVPSFDIVKKVGPFNGNEPQPESTLDVEYLGAVGGGNTNWYWTEQGWMLEFAQDLMNAGESGTPDIVSMSYSWSEEDQCQISPNAPSCGAGGVAGSKAFVARVNAEFAKVGLNGITLVASSGDSGAHGRTDPMCQRPITTPSFPASSPNVLAVGATQFDASTITTGGSSPFCQANSCKMGGTEIVCSTKTGAAITSGGGFSNVASTPSYQSSQVAAYISGPGVPAAGDFNSTGRGYPDVAALGHAYYIQLNGEAMAVDGTSASAPVMAGMLGLLAAKKGGKLGHVAPLLYKIYEADNSAFNDVTEGNNFCTESSCDCTTGFKATKGWDAATGLGSPNHFKMEKAMMKILNL